MQQRSVMLCRGWTQDSVGGEKEGMDPDRKGEDKGFQSKRC